MLNPLAVGVVQNKNMKTTVFLVYTKWIMESAIVSQSTVLIVRVPSKNMELEVYDMCIYPHTIGFHPQT